ncbi:MAG: nitrous oxide-stimulated promoter family protein [bacterium]|nr:nitrous oxide-stimulated promoter family protein [bacterium]
MNLQTKREREKKTVSLMIRLYCRKKHGGKQLCADCAALDAYARSRSDSCPFMETKTFCSNCTVHCYRPDMREEIRKVMRFSGPRMMLYHPVMAIRHVVSSRMEKKKMQKDLKAKPEFFFFGKGR